MCQRMEAMHKSGHPYCPTDQMYDVTKPQMRERPKG